VAIGVSPGTDSTIAGSTTAVAIVPFGYYAPYYYGYPPTAFDTYCSQLSPYYDPQVCWDYLLLRRLTELGRTSASFQPVAGVGMALGRGLATVQPHDWG
jgi:hypothetical protein